MKKLMLTAAVAALGSAAPAMAAPIFGTFTIGGTSGTYINTASADAATAMNATGLDFGNIGTGIGNGFGTNGLGTISDADGAFASLNATTASIADILLSGGVANPYLANPFISFGSNSAIQVNFNNASVSRTGTSVTVTGAATFTDGDPADLSFGTFSISTNSKGGSPASLNFSFTGNVGSNGAVPEPATWALMLLGFGVIGYSMRRRSAGQVVQAI